MAFGFGENKDSKAPEGAVAESEAKAPEAKVKGFEPKKFVPMLIRHEKGIRIIEPSTRRTVDITHKGYVPRTKEDQDHVLNLIAKDKYCGIVEFGQHEQPKNQRHLTNSLLEAEALNKTQAQEIISLKAELAKHVKA